LAGEVISHYSAVWLIDRNRLIEHEQIRWSGSTDNGQFHSKGGVCAEIGGFLSYHPLIWTSFIVKAATTPAKMA
jgi:hypothetical protein